MQFTWLLGGENIIAVTYFKSTKLTELKKFIIGIIQDVSREIKIKVL